jgi:hypothetical protein
VVILASLKTKRATKEPDALAMAKPSDEPQLESKMYPYRFSTIRNISKACIMLLLTSLLVGTQCFAADLSNEQIDGQVNACITNSQCHWLASKIKDEDIQLSLREPLKNECYKEHQNTGMLVRACYYAGMAVRLRKERSRLFLTACETGNRSDYRTKMSCNEVIKLAKELCTDNTFGDCPELNKNAHSAKEKICTFTAEIEAESLASARLAQEVGAVKAKAETRWASTGRRLSTCVKAEDINVRKQCLTDANKFIDWATSLEARLNEGVESVATSCGDRRVPIPARTQRLGVVVGHVVKMARQQANALEMSLLNEKQDGTRLSVDKNGLAWGLCFGLSTSCQGGFAMSLEKRIDYFVYGISSVMLAGSVYGGIYPSSSSNFSLRFGIPFNQFFPVGVAAGLNYQFYKNDELHSRWEFGVQLYTKSVFDDGEIWESFGQGPYLGNAVVLPNFSYTNYSK